MARQARGKSEAGIYHVMLRGIERKSIFLDEADKNRFIEIMLQKKDATASRLFAFCIMDNHVHMVIQETENGQPLEIIMKRIGITYAMYFNRKYKRVGHVFQDRFLSEIVATESHLFGVIRYVHMNPVKAGMIQGLDYAWSSYRWYVDMKSKLPLLPEMKEILDQFSHEWAIALEKFAEFHQIEDNQTFLDLSENERSENGEDILKEFLLRHNLAKEDFNYSENQAVLCELIEELVRKCGLSGRKIAEITGINREKVRRIRVSKEPSL